jgi:secreted trypsin-like serine protease
VGRFRIITAVVLSLGVAVSGLAGAGGALASRAIVGGTTATQGQFPFMAFIAWFNSSNRLVFICSGTLVSSNVVLTAGHCTVNEKSGVPNRAAGYRVITGTDDWNQSAHRTISDVSSVKVNPNYDPHGPKHDAGLLILSAPVSHAAVALWQSGPINAGTAAQIAGWGETSVGSGPPKRLRWGSSVVQSTSYCGHISAGNFTYDPASMLCAQDTPSNRSATCSGDSGGPLLVKQSGGTVLEVGVTSVGPGNCSTHRPDYFTAVRPIYPWISSQIKAFAP